MVSDGCVVGFLTVVLLLVIPIASHGYGHGHSTKGGCVVLATSELHGWDGFQSFRAIRLIGYGDYSEFEFPGLALFFVSLANSHRYGHFITSLRASTVTDTF